MSKIPYWACLTISQVHLAKFESVTMAMVLGVSWLTVSLVIGWFILRESE